MTKILFQAHIVELQNGSWIMESGKVNRMTYIYIWGTFWEYLQTICTKPFTTELMDVSGLWGLNKEKVEELFYLLVFVWSPRSQLWPRYNTVTSRKMAHGQCALHWTSGLIFEASLSQLDVKERPGKLPTLYAILNRPYYLNSSCSYY